MADTRRQRPRIELDPATLTIVARALARENVLRAERGQGPLTMWEYGRRELAIAARRQLSEATEAA